MKFRKFKHILNERYLLSALYLRDPSSNEKNMSCYIGGMTDGELFNVISDYSDEIGVEWKINVYICFEI